MIVVAVVDVESERGRERDREGERKGALSNN